MGNLGRPPQRPEGHLPRAPAHGHRGCDEDVPSEVSRGKIRWSGQVRQTNGKAQYRRATEKAAMEMA